jgi:hypothetical protein
MHACMCVYVSMCVSMCVCMYVYVCVCICVCMYVYVCVGMYVCMYVYVHIVYCCMYMRLRNGALTIRMMMMPRM